MYDYGIVHKKLPISPYDSERSSPTRSEFYRQGVCDLKTQTNCTLSLRIFSVSYAEQQFHVFIGPVVHSIWLPSYPALMRLGKIKLIIGVCLFTPDTTCTDSFHTSSVYIQKCTTRVIKMYLKFIGRSLIKCFWSELIFYTVPRFSDLFWRFSCIFNITFSATKNENKNIKNGYCWRF